MLLQGKGIGAYPWEALCSIAIEALGDEKHIPK